MTLIKLSGFQNNSTKKYRLLCLESTDDGWFLWETSTDLDYLPDPHTDNLATVRRPATFADYEQRRDQIVENGYTMVGER